MLKKVLLLGLLGLWFALSFTSMASEATTTSHKWLKFEVTVPTDFVFDKNVVIELINQDTNEQLVAYAKKEDSYIAYLNITEGTYIVSNVSVPGNYEGYFTFGYPEGSFLITKDTADMTVIPILVELHYYGDENTGTTTDNLYEGMTYEEVLKAVEDESAVATSESDQDPNKEVSNSLSQEEDTFDEDTELKDTKSLEDKITEIRDVYEEAEKTKAAKDKTNKGLMSGLVVMCLVLIGSGIGFYLFKEKRDL